MGGQGMKRGREVGAEQEAVGWGEAREPKMGTTTPRPPSSLFLQPHQVPHACSKYREQSADVLTACRRSWWGNAGAGKHGQAASLGPSPSAE